VTTIVILAEGDTERAAGDHWKRFLDQRAGDKPKVRLHIIRSNGALIEEDVRTKADRALDDASTIGVVALTDVYPKYASATAARETIAGWMPSDPRCRAHAACHDFEAWLLVGWDALVEHAHAGPRKPWGAHPEEIDLHNPPAHRIKALFQLGKPTPRKYSKPIDGKKLFEKLDLVDVAEACPEFKAFINSLLELSEYLTIP